MTLKLIEFFGYLHIFAKFDCLDFISETKLANALELVVVPEHHLVRRPFGTASTTYKRQYITTKKHLNNANATVQIPHKLPSKWDSIVDAEPALRADCETVLFLVKADVADLVCTAAPSSPSCHIIYLLINSVYVCM